MARSLNRSSTGRLFEGRKKTLFLLTAENGPVGKTVEEAAQDLVAAGHREIERIMGMRLDQDDLADVQDSLNYEMRKDANGPYAVIGLRDRGEIELYLAKDKEAREHWFTNALREVLG